MNSNTKVAFITGAAQRIGATIATQLHRRGYNIIIHYRNSGKSSQQLASSLNSQRAESAGCIRGDLQSLEEVNTIAEQALSMWGKVDVLVNNASSFYPTPIGSVSENDWDMLIGSNLKGPFFLSQQLTPTLKSNRGCIVNIIDIYADKPLKGHPVYCIAKAGLAMMTKSLASELAPEIRVNGISPGAILWPEPEPDSDQKLNITNKIPLKKIGDLTDISKAVIFLIEDAPYITGQILSVDGGRSLNN